MKYPEPKACPFCGCEETGMAHHGPHMIVKCRNCFASGPELEPDKQIGSAADKDAATISLWNKRAGDRESDASKTPSGEGLPPRMCSARACEWEIVAPPSICGKPAEYVTQGKYLCKFHGESINRRWPNSVNPLKTWVCGICKSEWKGDEDSDCPECSSLAPARCSAPPWNETEPPKDGKIIVAIGRVIWHDDISTAVDSFTAVVMWIKDESGYEGWHFAKDGMTVAHALDGEVKVDYWLMPPNDQKLSHRQETGTDTKGGVQ